MGIYLGVDVGGTKTAALISNGEGKALGFGVGGPGNYEGVGWEGFKSAIQEAVKQALVDCGCNLTDISAAGFGIAGYDWPSQKDDHLCALGEIGLQMEFEIVNDAVLGILAGAKDGWGVSVVSGTGCNCRGWSRDHKRSGRVVGGASEWSGEYAGGYDILTRSMRAVTFEWAQRGPKTDLTQVFLEEAGASDLGDLIEGLYTGRYKPFYRELAIKVFEVAYRGDLEALEVLRWAGSQLGDMVCGVVKQLELQNDDFDCVMIGSIFKGHPLIGGALKETVHQVAPCAKFVHLHAPPVVGAVLLAMEQVGLDGYTSREDLIKSTQSMIKMNEDQIG